MVFSTVADFCESFSQRLGVSGMKKHHPSSPKVEYTLKKKKNKENRE